MENTPITLESILASIPVPYETAEKPFAVKAQLYVGGKDPAIDPDFRGGEAGDTAHKTFWEVDPVASEEFGKWYRLCRLVNSLAAEVLGAALSGSIPPQIKVLTDLLGLGNQGKLVIMDSDGHP